MAECAGYLHEHFVNQIEIHRGRYKAPLAPGVSVEMKADSVAGHIYQE